jgi:hypothetical protein
LWVAFAEGEQGEIPVRIGARVHVGVEEDHVLLIVILHRDEGEPGVASGGRASVVFETDSRPVEWWCGSVIDDEGLGHCDRVQSLTCWIVTMNGGDDRDRSPHTEGPARHGVE